MFTIIALTLRQFLRAKSVLVVAGISLFPVIFAIIPHFANRQRVLPIRDIVGNTIYLGLFAATLLPLATLVLATAAFGDELEDRTLQYLTLKPISRLQIVLAKFIAVLLVTVPIVWIGLMLTWAVAAWGHLGDNTDLIWPMFAGSLVGVLGFGSLFMLVSLLIHRALLVGIFYVFIWETALSRYLTGIRTISIKHYTQSMFVRLADDRLFRIDSVAATSTIVATVVGIVVVSLGLATWRLRRMNLE
ncbi:MAG TPA: ABC transporter permease subunit [Thermomicrobiales bacterium]|nr:ABC transporter permease subunit [Thermomicrobiales bacterium]